MNLYAIFYHSVAISNLMIVTVQAVADDTHQTTTLSQFTMAIGELIPILRIRTLIVSLLNPNLNALSISLGFLKLFQTLTLVS